MILSTNNLNEDVIQLILSNPSFLNINIFVLNSDISFNNCINSLDYQSIASWNMSSNLRRWTLSVSLYYVMGERVGGVSRFVLPLPYNAKCQIAKKFKRGRPSRCTLCGSLIHSCWRVNSTYLSINKMNGNWGYSDAKC